MAIAPGTRFGPYEVTGTLGAGGMGEVYRATDTSLKRDVALKVLPESFVTDANRLARFQREAEVLASLNHVNIAHIYGLEKSGSTHALVMELVAGPTLAERIAQGPLPIDEALNVALQIADALEAAHEQGIVHRDLKPANVKLKPDGTVKVLDFGIAKALDIRATSGPQAPALTTPAMTQAGLVLGTAAYMSPEQARGKAVDRRADIWAFGCVLYEMLTGQPAFGGEDVTITLARVLERGADMSALPTGLSPAVRRTLELCLQKDLKKRIRDIGDVRLALEGVFAVPGGGGRRERPILRGALPTAIALVLGALIAGGYVWSLWPAPPAPAAVARFVVMPPATAPLANQGGYDVAISPDGTRLVYVARSLPSGQFTLYQRDLDALETRVIPGTEVAAGGSVNPFFSPDGKEIGFGSPGRGIIRVALEGGRPRKIVDYPADGFGGATWATDDTLIFSSTRSLYRVSADGIGTPEELTSAPGPTAFLVGPKLLPGERAVLFNHFDEANLTEDLVVLDLRTGQQTPVIEGGAVAFYTRTGHIVFFRDGTLMAAPFDLDQLAPTGDAVTLLQGIRDTPTTAADVAVSATGTLVYVPGSAETTRALVWVDRNGRIVSRAVDELLEDPRTFRLSPDNTRLAIVTGAADEGELWIHDLRGRPAILLADERGYGAPVWSPDGTQAAFTSNRSGTWETYVLPADGSVREPRLLGPPGQAARPAAWSSNGELLAVRDHEGNFDIVVTRLETESEVREIVATEDAEYHAALSPNGRWLAYISDRTGEPEVWVKPYPDGVAQRISRGGGAREPVWSRDGRELFYLQANAMMAVSVATEGEFPFAEPVQLFTEPYVIREGPFRRSYDVDPDGRFLMTAAGDDSGWASIVVVQNWFEELKRRVPTQ